MPKIHNPAGVAPPASAFAHGVEVAGVDRWLIVSGQVPTDRDGKMPADPVRQHELCWERIFAVLESADMARTDIVKVQAFLTRADDVGLYREVRDRMMGGHVCASTLLIVHALAHPDWTVEIEATAAA